MGRIGMVANENGGNIAQERRVKSAGGTM